MKRFSRCLVINLAAILYSGGKDSHYALIKALVSGYTIKRLIIVKPLRDDSWLFHAVNVEYAILHANLMGIEYELVTCSGIKDLEVNELKKALTRLTYKGFKYLISGVVQSTYQKKVLDSVCKDLSLIHVTPLWGMNPQELLKEEVGSLGFMITAINAYGLSPKWLGMKLSSGNVEEFLRECIKHGINPVGEGGEYETLVLESPLFNNKRLCVISSKTHWHPYQWSGYLTIDEISIC